MYSTIAIAALCCAALIATVIFKPEVKIKKFTLPLYPVVALIGALLTLAFTPLTFADCVSGILGSGAVNPIKILTLFISVTAISIFLDEGGFFKFLAQKMLFHAGNRQTKLFFILYVTVSVLTVFTSNDIIILTFTPFIIYFCRSANIKALPYLMAEFVAANTWSMALVIGNPTNIYLATAAGLNFFTYAKTMILPTVCSGTVSAGVLFLLFKKSLKAPCECVATVEPVRDRPTCVLGCCVLLICTVSLAVSNFIGVEMWLECVICFGALILIALTICLIERKKPVALGRTLLRLPYSLIPFVLSMFVISLALDKTGVTKIIAGALDKNELILYGISSFVCSNLVNNIPMSIIFSSMICAGNAGEGAVYASIIGSNLGAILTPVGALAGIMFSSICKKHGEKVSALQFIKYGSVVSVASLAAALSSLALVMYVF